MHADLVFLLIGLSVALWFALRAVGAPAGRRAAAVCWSLSSWRQGLIGFVQYFTHLPALLVGAHMLGACLVWIATLGVLWSTRAPPVTADPARRRPPPRARHAPGARSGRAAGPDVRPAVAAGTTVERRR